MKKLGFTILAVAALGLPLCAQEVISRANIPFEFNVRKATAPPGQYVIRLSAGPVVQLVARNDCYFLQSSPNGPSRTGQEAKLVFHRYGDRYFLSNMTTAYTSRDFPKSRVERELRKTAAAGRNEAEIVVAMR